MTTSPANIDYDAILQGLIEIADQRFEKNLATTGMQPAMALRELRTVGITAPRQTGKTSWVIRQLSANPDSFVVVNNNDRRKEILRKAPLLDSTRILTVLEFQRLKKQLDEGLLPAHWIWRSTVYVDDCRFILDGKLKDFYNWLAYNPEWKKMFVVVLS